MPTAGRCPGLGPGASRSTNLALLRDGALDGVAGTSLEVEARLGLQMLVGVPALGQPTVAVRPQVEFWDRAALSAHR